MRDMIEAAGATLLYLPLYSPDFNPIDSASLLRKAAERTVDVLWSEIGNLIKLVTPAESQNYFAAASYDAT